MGSTFGVVDTPAQFVSGINSATSEVTDPINDSGTTVEHDYGDFAIRLIPLMCRIVEGEPHPHEHDAIRWVGPDEVGGLEWAAADVPVVAEWVG